MEKLKKLYGGVQMTWRRTILFALITGIYTGCILMVNFLYDTSFQDIGISYEWWVIFAVIIVVNCEKNYEAMLKCFVFFLISQPLVYAVEVLGNFLSFDMGMYYYLKIWLPITFLTIPGGFIAYYCKKETFFGAVVLGIGNTIQALMGIYYSYVAIQHFPHHLLSALTCFISMVWMSFLIQKQSRYRIISLAVPVALSLLTMAIVKLSGLTFFTV